MGRDSSVGIATQDGLEHSGDRIPVEGEIFRSRPDRPGGPPSLQYNVYWVSFPWVKRSGRGVDHPPKSRAEVTQTVDLYLYSPNAWYFSDRASWIDYILIANFDALIIIYS